MSNENVQVSGEPVAYAKSIAQHLYDKYWKSEAPDWEPLDDLYGLLSQIDNMVAGIVDTQPHALAAAQAENKRLREALETLAEHFEYYMGDNECRPIENARAALSTPADTSELDRLVADAGRAKWQPIETAPKDKAIILSDGYNVNTGRWVGRYFSWGSGVDPLFWMPLPDAPEAACAEVKS